MTEITYSVRHSSGKTWAVDEYEWWESRDRGRLGTKNKTWYLPTEEEAILFKQNKEKKENGNY